MRRRISGFHQDELGDWVAELSCLHNQHVRHRPPFQERPWVLSEEGRTDRLGSELACLLCARAELPSGLSVRRHLGPFDETDLPSGLRKAHRVSAGQWGLLRILSGSVDFWMESEPPVTRHLSAGVEQPIPPEVRHELRLTGPVSLTIELLSV